MLAASQSPTTPTNTHSDVRWFHRAPKPFLRGTQMPDDVVEAAPSGREVTDAITLWAMNQDEAQLTVRDADVLHGQARVRGTRIAVSVILDCLGAGLSEADIRTQYPTLTPPDIRAASSYAAALAA